MSKKAGVYKPLNAEYAESAGGKYFPSAAIQMQILEFSFTPSAYSAFSALKILKRRDNFHSVTIDSRPPGISATIIRDETNARI
jgi:hypothetical protein